MNPGKTLLLLQFLLCAATAAAQSAEVRFRVADRATREAVVGAVAELRSRTEYGKTQIAEHRSEVRQRTHTHKAVSYTHLTLPTILLV